MSYQELLDFLKVKYGLPNNVYSKATKRTSEGLFIHHDLENKYIMLSTHKFASLIPESQLPENLTFCNYLEHFLLHLKIAQEHTVNKQPLNLTLFSDAERQEMYQKTLDKSLLTEDVHELNVRLGEGGIRAYFIPELDDWYSGNIPTHGWKANIWNAIKDDKASYEMLKRKYEEEVR